MKKSMKISVVILVVILGSYFAPLYVTALSDSDYEPNNDFAHAATITEGTHSGLTLTDSTDEDDWFKIEVPKDMVLNVKMEVTDSVDGNYFYLNLKDNNDNYIGYDGFNYYVSPSEYDDVIGDESFYNNKETQTVYIWCEWYYSNTGDATYTLTIEIYDPKGDPVFDYGIAVGDDLVFTESNNIDITATPNFYNEIGALFVDGIENSTGETVFSNSFNFSNFVNDFTNFISLNFDSNFSISDIYNFDIDPNDNMSIDAIEGSIRMGNDGDFVLPSAFAKGKIQEFQTTFEPYFDSTFFKDNIEPNIEMAIDGLDNATADDFDNLPIATHVYFENITDALGFSVDPLDNGTTFPSFPSEHYLPFNPMMGMLGLFSVFGLFNLISNSPICFPTDFSYADWYNWGLDAYDYAKAYADQENENIEIFAYSIEQLMNIGGISSFHVDKQSIGFVWDLNGIDFATLDDLMNYTEGDLENDFDVALAEAGIDYNNSGASFSIAIEYDSNMVLASVAVYGDLTLTFTNEKFPDVAIDGETVNIAVSQSIVREGYKAPSAEQIQDGKIGENRNLKGGFSLSSIPGAPLGLIGVASLLSLAAVLVYIKRRK